MSAVSVLFFTQQLAELVDVLGKLTPFEADLVASLVRLTAFGKLTHLSESQAETLNATYFKHVVLPRLPAEMQKPQKSQQAKKGKP